MLKVHHESIFFSFLINLPDFNFYVVISPSLAIKIFHDKVEF